MENLADFPTSDPGALDLPPAKGAGELLDYAAHVFSREPYNLTKYCRPVVRKKLRALLQEEKYDVIVCDFLVTAGAIPWDCPCPKVLFTPQCRSGHLATALRGK